MSDRKNPNVSGVVSLVVFLLVVALLFIFVFHRAEAVSTSADTIVVYKDYYFFSLVYELERDPNDGWQVKRRDFTWF